MSIIFQRFETINGQRNIWQNMLVKEWVSNLTKEKIDNYAKKYNIDLNQYCYDPYKKVLTGGSDEHLGLLAGITGSYLYVPNLKEKLKTKKISELALDAIRKSKIIPYAIFSHDGSMVIPFLIPCKKVCLSLRKILN